MAKKLDLTGNKYRIDGRVVQVIKQGPTRLGGAGDSKTTWLCKDLGTNKTKNVFTKNLRRATQLF